MVEIKLTRKRKSLRFKASIAPWLSETEQWKKDFPDLCQNGTLKPQYVIEKVFELTKGKAIITTEVNTRTRCGRQ